MAHGFTGDKDEWGRFVKTAEEFCKNGFAVFRFDFSVSGESEGDSITVKQWVDDLKSAINFVKQKGYSNIGLLGLSLGGLCSILAYNENIKTIVLWEPVTKAKTPTKLKEEIQAELNEKGYTIIKNKAGKKFKIPKEYLIERETINQQEILSKIRCLVLIIHGDRDDVVPVDHSREAIKYLPKESKLEVIENADHGFYEQLDKIISISLNWFKRYLVE